MLYFLIDVHFYYQNKHNILKSMSSFISYDMFQPFVSAVIS